MMTGAALETFMSGPGWALCAFVAAVFTGWSMLINQFMQQRGDIIVFWMRVAIVVCLLPVMTVVQLPRDIPFYLAVAGTAVCAAVADVILFNVCARYGGGIASRVQPLKVWAAFFLWFLFDPALLGEYAAHPVNTAVILAALGGCVFFARRQSRYEVSHSALREMIPALALYAMTIVLNKFAMTRGELGGVVFGYMFIQSALAVIMLGGWRLWRMCRGKAETVLYEPRKIIRTVALLTFTWIAHMGAKNVAMAYVPNPSYVAAITLTSSLFIAVYYHFTRHKEEGDVRNGMGVVACAVILVLATI